MVIDTHVRIKLPSIEMAKRASDSEAVRDPARLNKIAKLILGDDKVPSNESLENWFECDVPFNFSRYDMLSVVREKGCTTGCSDDREWAIFSRHLGTFRNGEVLRKVSGPYGKRDDLLERDLILLRKGVSCTGELLHAEVYDPALAMTLLLDSEFLDGWTNEALRKERDQFHEKAVDDKLRPGAEAV